jgi:hypothetical protein
LVMERGGRCPPAYMPQRPNTTAQQPSGGAALLAASPSSARAEPSAGWHRARGGGGAMQRTAAAQQQPPSRWEVLLTEVATCGHGSRWMAGGACFCSTHLARWDPGSKHACAARPASQRGSWLAGWLAGWRPASSRVDSPGEAGCVLIGDGARRVVPPCMPRAESSAGWHCAMGAGARQCNAQQPAAASSS